ncbi:ABC transporter permease [Paucibacter aquatile]|uniref:ABC transporter permease n=1 Tax=Kinneretia aquatilis TaxID=2070761 RepID=A0A2N8L1G3_9BURK|nr:MULTISPECIES: FtsX-like permease family protein [Roseateles]PND39553.1 ABC transporter permease [Paucibacter aquatile]
MLAHRLALRNLLRHRRRSGFTAAIIVITMALLTCFQGLSDGGHQAMIQVGVRMGLGHLILSQQGHAQDPSLERLISAGPQALALVRASAGPLAQSAVPRLRFSAMAQAGAQQIAVTASGVDPALELPVSGIADARAIVQGQPLPAESATEDGRSASGQAGLPPLVLGERLAKALDVRIGDRVTLTVKPLGGGEFARAAFQLHGIFRTGIQELDAFWVELPLPQAQTLSRSGQGISHLALYLQDERQLAALQERLQPVLQARGWEAQTWTEAAPELNSAVAMDAAGMALLMVIVVVVVVAGILNTVIMSVLKRHREFGVMLALGSSPGLIVRVVLLESLYLAGASLALGLMLGLAAHAHFATEGLNFREVFGTGLEAGGVLLPERFYSLLNPLKLAGVAALILVLTLLVSLMPAVKSGRLKPIEAIQHHA